MAIWDYDTSSVILPPPRVGPCPHAQLACPPDPPAGPLNCPLARILTILITGELLSTSSLFIHSRRQRKWTQCLTRPSLKAAGIVSSRDSRPSTATEDLHGPRIVLSVPSWFTALRKVTFRVTETRMPSRVTAEMDRMPPGKIYGTGGGRVGLCLYASRAADVLGVDSAEPDVEEQLSADEMRSRCIARGKAVYHWSSVLGVCMYWQKGC